MLGTRPLSAHNYAPFPYIMSIGSPFNLNFLNISTHNETCLKPTLKHTSYTASIHPELPPFPLLPSPSAAPSTSISWKSQPATKHVWDWPWNMLRTRPLSTQNYTPFPQDHPVCNPFNLNFLHISAHNKEFLRLALTHASYTAFVRPQVPPFWRSSPPVAPSTSISFNPHRPQPSTPSLALLFHPPPRPRPCSIHAPRVHTRPHPVSLPSLFHPHPRPHRSTPSLVPSIFHPDPRPHPVSLPSLFHPPSTPLRTQSRSPSRPVSPLSFFCIHTHTAVHTLPPVHTQSRSLHLQSSPASTPITPIVSSRITPIPFSTPIPYHTPIMPIPYHIHPVSHPSRSIIISYRRYARLTRW